MNRLALPKANGDGNCLAFWKVKNFQLVAASDPINRIFHLAIHRLLESDAVLRALYAIGFIFVGL
jgi:hypothetical protein